MTQVFSMKNKLMMAILLLAVAALVTVTLGTYLVAPAKADDSPVEKRTLSVSGQAKVSASPDIAYINLGVISEDKDAKVAQRANAAAMEKVVASIKANGIKVEDIKTVNYSINPKYNYNQKDGTSTIIGYSVNNSVSVTVRDLSKTGNIIDAASDSGVNLSSSISFGLSNYEKFYNDALKNAVLAAKKKAGTMAEALGVTLKGPLSVSEGGGYSPLQNYVSYDMKAESAGAVTPVQSGSLEITANVNAVYEY
jgi:uncharacterized protein YggE